jgi:hypothetical protein
MRQILYATAVMMCATAAWGSSFFGIELTNNAIQDTTLKVDTPAAGMVELGSGTSLGLYIGSEMALDFNLKLDLELGFQTARYLINEYTVNSLPIDVGNSMNYTSYVVMTGVRIKYDLQITDSVSIEPYILGGLTPLYQYSPSRNMHHSLDVEIDGGGGDRSFTYSQSNIWALNYWGPDPRGGRIQRHLQVPLRGILPEFQPPRHVRQQRGEVQPQIRLPDRYGPLLTRPRARALPCRPAAALFSLDFGSAPVQ